jgi:hypothetical protein
MRDVTHSALESWLEGRELLRLLFQDHVTLRKTREPKRLEVVGSEGTARREVVEDEERPLDTIFGPKISVERLAYRAPRKEVGNLMPLDGELNLPRGLQKRAALEIAGSSFDDTRETIRQRTGVKISKDQRTNSRTWCRRWPPTSSHSTDSAAVGPRRAWRRSSGQA